MDHEKLTRRAWAGAIGSVALFSPTAADAAGANTGPAGGGTPVNNMPPALALSYIIATQGIFPSRDGGTNVGVMLAEVRRFAGNFAPAGWAFCDGQVLAINTNTALFSLLGTQYGGNGVTTFALPDLRGRTPIHVGQGPGLSNRLIGEQGGQESVALTAAMNPAHTHTNPAGGITGPSGGSAAIGNMMPYLGLTFIISVSAGGFPARDGSNPATFLAEVRMFAGNFAPSGWAATDGQVLSISSNTALFSLLGTTYGGNGTTTFALPDLRGHAPVGAGTGPGLSPRVLGQATGQEAVQLTAAQMPAHTHTSPTGGNTGSAGGGQSHSHLQPTLALNAIFAMTGAFPSPSNNAGDNFLDEIRLFAGNFAPGGWAFADGTVLAINTNTAVFSLTGTQYGGNGQTNFALPDLRGRAAIQRGQGAGLSLRTIGDLVGTELETLTASQMGVHTHLVQFPLADVPALSRTGLALLTATMAALGAVRIRRSDET